MAEHVRVGVLVEVIASLYHSDIRDILFFYSTNFSKHFMEQNYRNRSGFWKEATIVYSAPNEKGITVKHREQYVVESLDFIQAQTRITKEMECANRKITVDPIKTPKYGEICFNESSNCDDWWKVKVQITEDVEVKSRKGGTKIKTKIRTREHLVQAESDAAARNAIHECVYKGSTEDWEIVQSTKTKILGVLEVDKHLSALDEERAEKERKDAELKK